ncbi:MAG: hypothetical protein QF501_02505 [Anaerolineales bacterium]|nr:hypothetical protein [Anaerolineales bacterium]HJO33885.1 hypothetical protein [Anaerolineales bacterium]
MNRLETEMGEGLQIIRLNVHDPVGRQLGDRFDFRFTPTFIFFDANGIEQWRSLGTLDTDRVRSSVTTQ